MENTFSKIVTHLMPSAPDWDALFPPKKKIAKVKVVKPKVVKVVKVNYYAFNKTNYGQTF